MPVNRENATSRNDFNETWLFEMPMGIGKINTFQEIEYIIRERQDIGTNVIKLQNNFFKMVGYTLLYYWWGSETEVVLGIELQIKPQGLVVNLVGKNPSYKGKFPFASDLYDVILRDTDESIRILSDEQLSDEGYGIWKKLLSTGHKISVYDAKEPGKTFQYFKTFDDMDQYFKLHNNEYKRYQFILSESVVSFGDTVSQFRTRRYRETAGIDLED